MNYGFALSISGYSWLATALLFVVLSIPLILEKIKPNSVYGVRNSHSFESEEAWYKINKKGGFALCTSGITILILSLGMIFWPWAVSVFVLIGFNIVPVIMIIGASIYAWR